MAGATQTLERAGIHLDPQDFDRLVAEALAEVVPLRPAADPARELTADEEAILRDGGFDLTPLPLDATHPVARTAAAYAALLSSSLAVGQAAEQLGINESRVRQRLGERTLYGVKTPRGWRLPRFQFESQGTVRGIAQVFPRLAEDLHPLAVVGWFLTPNPDLAIGSDARPTSPLDWLRGGYPVEPVVALAADLDALP